MHKDVFVSKPEEVKDVNYPADIFATVSGSGLPRTSNYPSGHDEDRVAALSAATYTWATEMICGSVEQVFLKSADHCVVMYFAEDEADLSVIARSCAKCRETQNPRHCINALLNIA